jgi:hypothetical protein
LFGRLHRQLALPGDERLDRRHPRRHRAPRAC